MSRCTDINICIPQYLFPSTAPARCARMFDDDVHMSGVHNPGAGCPIRRPSDLSAPHICTRSSHCPRLPQQSTSALQLPPLHIVSLARRGREGEKDSMLRERRSKSGTTHAHSRKEIGQLHAGRLQFVASIVLAAFIKTRQTSLRARNTKLLTRLCPLVIAL